MFSGSGFRDCRELAELRRRGEYKGVGKSCYTLMWYVYSIICCQREREEEIAARYGVSGEPGHKTRERERETER